MAAEPTATPADNGTEYVVLRFTGEGGDREPPTYELVGRNLRVNSAGAAIRTYVKRAGGHADGLFVAIPARSWKPIKVTSETTTVLKLQDA